MLYLTGNSAGENQEETKMPKVTSKRVIITTVQLDGSIKAWHKQELTVTFTEDLNIDRVHGAVINALCELVQREKQQNS